MLLVLYVMSGMFSGENGDPQAAVLIKGWNGGREGNGCQFAVLRYRQQHGSHNGSRDGSQD